MATEHVDIPNAECHEPKHITDSITADSGKVITPSSSVAGTSVLRELSTVDVGYVIAHTMIDINIPFVDYIAVQGAVTLDSIRLTTSGNTSITTDTVVSVKQGIGGSTIGTLTIPAGSTAGTSVSAAFSTAFTDGQILELNSDGGGANAVRGHFTIRFKRTA
jgi:hypothetical protein